MLQTGIPILFVVLSVALRLLPHTWNVAPVVAVGLFCGAYMPKRRALLVSVAALAVGDLLLGWIPEHLFGWAAVALSVVLGGLLTGRKSVLRIAGTSIAGSSLFFLLSNFGVWLFGCGKGWYAPDFSGLAACYAAGIPFYKNGVFGDLLYSGLLFGSYEFLLRWFHAPSPKAALTR